MGCESASFQFENAFVGTLILMIIVDIAEYLYLVCTIDASKIFRSRRCKRRRPGNDAVGLLDRLVFS